MIEYFDAMIALASFILAFASTFMSRGQVKLLEDLIILMKRRAEAE